MTDLFPSHGGFRQLRSFQVAQQVYDGTTVFCSRFIDRRSRTHDQMVQAARSGVQNIAEGSLASATSKKTENEPKKSSRVSVPWMCCDFERRCGNHCKFKITVQTWCNGRPGGLNAEFPVINRY